MRDIITPLIQFQRFFIPAILILLAWAIWRLLIRRDLAVGLALYLGLVVVVDGFLNTGIYLPGIEKGSIRYSEICAAFLLLHRLPLKPNRPVRGAIYGLLCLYFGLLTVSVLRSDPMIPALFEFRSVIIPQIVACIVASRGLDSSQSYRRFFVTLSALIVIVGVFNFWDVFFDRWIFKSDMLEKPIYAYNRERSRFGSLFLNPNYLGAFVVLVFPSAFVWTLAERRPLTRLYGWMCLLLLMFCLVQTQSRAPLLAFSVGLLLLVVGPCGGMSRTRRVGLLALISLVFVLALPGFYERALGRFSDLDRETSSQFARSRQTTWTYTTRMVTDNPIGGIGFGEPQFMRAMLAYGFETEFGFDVESLDAPHNSYLQVAVYAGIPALVAFVLANLLLLGRACAFAWRNADASHTATAFGLAVGVTGFLVSIVPDLQLFTANIAPVYWVFFGMSLSIVSGVQREEFSRTVVVPRPASAFGVLDAKLESDPFSHFTGPRRPARAGTGFRTADAAIRTMGRASDHR